jgi:hypothetical protein
MLQLNPPIPLETSMGSAWAVALIDYGPDHDLLWVCFLRDSRECWTILNRDVRQVENMTYGRTGDPE